MTMDRIDILYKDWMETEFQTSEALSEAQRALNIAYENYIVARSKDDFRNVFTFAEAALRAGTK